MSGPGEDIGAGLERHGYAVIAGVMGGTPADAAFDHLVAESASGSRRVAPTHDLVRRVLGVPWVSRLVSNTLGGLARPVRAIAFDKTAASNWSVPWHQDRSIAVDRRGESPELGNWTVKSGVPHCEAPVRLLEQMLTLRWHLDPVGPEDGCLRVLPGSHRLGRLTAGAISALLPEVRPRDVSVPAGGLLAMRPLLVHSSRRRTTAGHRRVLHIELAAGDPPAPLRWAWA